MGDEVSDTAKFVSMFDCFFDILNVSNFMSGIRNRKPFQQPYRHGEDSRIKVYKFILLCTQLLKLLLMQWLEETFLPYLDDWERSVNTRQGFSKAEKKRMMLSTETLLGLRMTGVYIYMCACS